MATATTRRKASLSSAERLIVVIVVYVVVKLSMSSEAAKNINITSYYSLLSHTFSSFYVAHLAQPNESSRRRVVAVIKNDWAAPNPKWFKTRTNRSYLPGVGDW
jgi:hypothetical protein